MPRFPRFLLALLAALCIASPALAQTAAPAKPAASAQASPKPLTAADLEKTLALLKNDAARADFTAKLEALVAAANAANAPVPAATTPATAAPAPAAIPAKTPQTPVDLLGNFLVRLTDSVGDISDFLTEAAIAVGDAPKLADWAVDQWEHPERIEYLARLAWQLALILVSSIVAERLVIFLLRPVQRRLSEWKPKNWWSRLGLAILRALLDFAAIAAFAAAAYIVTPLVGLHRSARLIAFALVNANLLARLILAATRVVLAPGVAAARPVKLADETATYLYVWAWRLATITVYGSFAIQAAFLLGTGREAFDLLQRLLGLIVLTMLVIFVLQNRTPVADWIRQMLKSKRGERAGAVRLFGRRFADVWHIVMIVYLLAVYIVWAVGVQGGFEYIVRVTLLSIVVAVAARLTDLSLNRLVDRGFTISDDLTDRLPDLQNRANRYLPLLLTVLRGTLGLVTLILLLQVWGANSFAWLASSTGRSLVSSAVTILFVLAFAVIFWELVSAFIVRYLAEVDENGTPISRSARVRTLLPLLRNAMTVVLVAVVILVVLSELGVNIAPLLAGAGVVGLAIGFGSQTLVRDVITGMFILFEDSIRVGDVVEVAGKTGVVEGLNIRALSLRDGSGNLLMVPFSTVTMVMNMTKDYSYYVIDIPFDFGHDPNTVRDTLYGVDAEMRADPAWAAAILAQIDVQGVDRFQDGKMVLKARIKTTAGQQWSVGREFNQRVQAKLIEAGIWAPPAPAPAPINLQYITGPNEV